MKRKEGLFSNLELKGEFWKVGTPDQKLHGTLKYSLDRGASLDLHGMFSDESFKQGIIHGLVEGRACTLHKSYYFGSTQHMADGHQRFSRFQALYLFLGAHLDPETTQLVSMEMTTTGLEEWYGHDAFKTDEEGRVQIVPFDHVPTEVVCVGANVGIGYVETFSDVSLTEMNWRLVLHFDFDPKEKKGFEEYFWGHRRNLLHLLSLLVGKPVYPRSVILKLSKDETVEVFSKDGDNSTDSERISMIEMIAPYRAIKGSWPQIVQKWFEVCAQFEPTVMLFFRARFDPNNVPSDFLHLMQAIESYHRQKHPGSMTLNQRLTQLFSGLPPEILRLVKFEDSVTTIEQLVVDRNYLTHYSANLKPRISDTFELWALAKGIEVILEYVLLIETNVPKDVVLKRLPIWRNTLFNQRS